MDSDVASARSADPFGGPDADDGFDAWVTARYPALIRFAYLVTGSQPAAENAVRLALGRAREQWPRVRRMDDREAYLRRLIVNGSVSRWRRAPGSAAAPADSPQIEGKPGGASQEDVVWQLCAEMPPIQRASVVLRFHEDLNYRQIATILGSREVTVRSGVQQALQALRTALDEDGGDDRRLEELLRRSLMRRAEEADAYGEYAATARADARRRRRTKRAAAGAGALAVVAAVAATTLTADPDPDSVADRQPTGPRTSLQPPVDADTTRWRVESYDGVQLRVPPRWGWGGVPVLSRQGLTYCGDGAYAYPTRNGTQQTEDRAMPYVGRPGYALTDVCVSGLDREPRHPFVWFGSPADEGSAELTNGFWRETVDVEGVRISVVDDDPDELAAIVGSIQAVDSDAHGCPAWERLPERWGSLAAVDGVSSVAVCLYQAADPLEQNPRVDLGYSTAVTGVAADELLDRLRARRPLQHRCAPQTPAPDIAVLWFQGSGSATHVRVDIYDCPGYRDSDGWRPLGRADVALWLVDAVPLYAGGGMVGNALTPFGAR